jgi:hypothetical protein
MHCLDRCNSVHLQHALLKRHACLAAVCVQQRSCLKWFLLCSQWGLHICSSLVCKLNIRLSVSVSFLVFNASCREWYCCPLKLMDLAPPFALESVKSAPHQR